MNGSRSSGRVFGSLGARRRDGVPAYATNTRERAGASWTPRFRKHPAQAHAYHGLPITRAITGARRCVLGFDPATIARTYDGVR